MTTTSTTPKDFTLQLKDGFQIAGQSYIHDSSSSSSSSSIERILLIHGSMDNCRSYHLLAPALLEHYQKQDTGCEIVAIDLPGHGRSDWRDETATVVAVDYVIWIAQIIEALEWKDRRIGLVGHSMGSIIASAYAAAFPEQVSTLVVLEGTKLLNGQEERLLPQELQTHIRQRLAQQAKNKSAAAAGAEPVVPKYESLDQLVQIRKLTIQHKAPGKQYISYEAARELAVWGTKENETDGTVQWRLDPRLHMPHLFYLSLEQVVAIVEAIQCPVCLLVAQDGWPMENKSNYETVIRAMRPVVNETLPGSHSFHADPNDAPAVIQRVIEFLGSSDTK